MITEHDFCNMVFTVIYPDGRVSTEKIHAIYYITLLELLDWDRQEFEVEADGDLPF